MATLVYSDADGVDRSFALGSDPVIVGRGPECAIQSKDPRVSRQHARFFVDQGALWVEDLGSSNGIYVGPNKVQRAPVPMGEIILVGSLVIRLLPATGTLPPPNGLHGTLATWLDLERKARAAVEEERDAFARRVGEMHQQVAALREMAPPSTTMRDGSISNQQGSPFDIGGDTTAGAISTAEAVRMRDEADAQVARLEQALAAMHDELEMLRRAAGAQEAGADLVRLRDELAAARARIVAFELEGSQKAEWSTGQVEQKLTTLQNTLEEEQSARSRAEHVAAEAQRDSMSLRQELDELRRTSAAEIEIARLDVQKTKEHKNIGETIAGTVAAERLAESDMVIAGLQRDLEQARAQMAGPDLRVRELQEINAVVMGRAEKAEKELSAAQIRAQGAERNLAHANTQATKAEARAAQIETRLQDAEDKAKAAEAELAQVREKVAALEQAAASQNENFVTLDTRGGDAELAAAEAKLTKIVIELEAQKTRVAELELAAGERVEQLRDADARVTAAKTEASAAVARVAEAEQRAVSLQARIEQLGRADSAIEAAAKAKADAADVAAAADKRVIEAERRSDDAEKRASAADTMAKAMAKDVAEALRRAAEADMRARSVARELGDAKSRAESAEAVRATASGALAGVEKRAVDAEAELARAKEELPGKLAAVEAELKKKLEATQRELAAERSTALAMVDRKTLLERELTDSREKLPASMARAEEAEKKLAEAEIHIESLQDRVLDLESGMAVSETAQQASLADAREEIKALKLQLVEASSNVGKLTERVAELEDLLADSERALAMVDGALREAKNQLADLERAAQTRSDSEASHQERLEDALARAGEAEGRIEQLTVQAEAADLAIGRANALQRQLDEAISKLAWMERQGRGDANADAKLRDAEARLKDAEGRVQSAEARIGDAERRTQVAQAKQQELADHVAKLERRAPEQVQVQVPVRDPEVERQLVAAQERVSALEREVAAADNVRSFAAETEREIAQLQRELREARSKITQVTLERDRLAIEVRDARINDDETTGRRTAIKEAVKPPHDPDATGVLDVAKMESIISRASEAEQKLVQAEREVAALRTRLADTEDRLRAAIDRPDDDDAESTRTGSQLPIVLGEHVSILEESIDSLRANMRAASDETAIMDQTNSVIAVASAVSQAAEHIERARAAIRALAAAIGMAS